MQPGRFWSAPSAFSTTRSSNSAPIEKKALFSSHRQHLKEDGVAVAVVAAKISTPVSTLLSSHPHTEPTITTAIITDHEHPRAAEAEARRQSAAADRGEARPGRPKFARRRRGRRHPGGDALPGGAEESADSRQQPAGKGQRQCVPSDYFNQIFYFFFNFFSF